MLLKQNQPKLEHQRNNFLRTDQQKQRGKNTLLRIPSLGCIMIGDNWISRTRRTFWDHFFLTSHIFCGCPHVNHTNTHFLPTSHTWILYCPQRSRSEKVLSLSAQVKYWDTLKSVLKILFIRKYSVYIRNYSARVKNMTEIGTSESCHAPNSLTK